MNKTDLSFHSAALGKQMEATVLLPDDPAGPMATLYLLHGNSGNQNSWLLNSTLAQRNRRNLMIIMPNGDRSRYVNSPLGRYEDLILQDLIPLIDSTFQTDARREKRAIGGFSMGGYGAMMLGLKHPHLFSAITTHAGSYYHAEWIPRPGGWLDSHPAVELLAPVCSNPDHDCRFLSQKALDLGNPPAIRFDCGVEDGALECARGLHQHFEKIGLPHQYDEVPGGHTWAYVDSRLEASQAFVMSTLNM